MTNNSDSDIDTSFYVLCVDLWSADGTRSENLVKHPSTSPSISTAVITSYPPPPQSFSPNAYPQYGQNAYNPSVGYPPMNNYYGGNQAYQSQYGYPQYYPGGQAPPAQPGSGSNVNYARNLIGSLSASAFRLTDLNEKFGIWFILQDLSVRTEGVFRLVSPIRGKIELTMIV